MKYRCKATERILRLLSQLQLATNFSPKYWDFVGLGLHLLFVLQNEYHSSSYILLG